MSIKEENTGFLMQSTIPQVLPSGLKAAPMESKWWRSQAKSLAGELLLYRVGEYRTQTYMNEKMLVWPLTLVFRYCAQRLSLYTISEMRFLFTFVCGAS